MRALALLAIVLARASRAVHSPLHAIRAAPRMFGGGDGLRSVRERPANGQQHGSGKARAARPSRSVTAAASLLGRLTAEAFGRSRSREPGPVRLRQFTFLCRGTHTREVNASLLPAYLSLPVDQFVLYDTRLMRRLGDDVFELSLPLSAPSGKSAVYFCPTLRVRVRSEMRNEGDTGDSGALHFESVSCRLLAEDVTEPGEEEADDEEVDENEDEGTGRVDQSVVGITNKELLIVERDETSDQENSAMQDGMAVDAEDILKDARGANSTGESGGRASARRRGSTVLQQLSDRRRRVALALRGRSLWLWRRAWDGADEEDDNQYYASLAVGEDEGKHEDEEFVDPFTVSADTVHSLKTEGREVWSEQAGGSYSAESEPGVTLNQHDSASNGSASEITDESRDQPDNEEEGGPLREGGMAMSLARSFELRFNTTLTWRIAIRDDGADRTSDSSVTKEREFGSRLSSMTVKPSIGANAVAVIKSPASASASATLVGQASQRLKSGTKWRVGAALRSVGGADLQSTTDKEAGAGQANTDTGPLSGRISGTAKAFDGRVSPGERAITPAAPAASIEDRDELVDRFQCDVSPATQHIGSENHSEKSDRQQQRKFVVDGSAGRGDIPQKTKKPLTPSDVETLVQLHCSTRAEVEVGLPPPFTYAPKPLVQGAANLVRCAQSPWEPVRVHGSSRRKLTFAQAGVGCCIRSPGRVWDEASGKGGSK
eukprot:scaffold40201_cov27-Tisochrysis_lutea.AAC.3